MTAITRSVDHRYTFEGKTYPGVTSILKVIDKSDALMAWASRQTAEAMLALLKDPSTINASTYAADKTVITDYEFKAYPSLTSLLEAAGPEGFIKAVTARSSWKRDEAAQVGSAIHGYADKIAQGLDTGWLDPAILERVNHYAEWWKTSGWTLRLSEAMVVNTEFSYGGTFDLLARDRDGKTVLADVKTGKAVYKEAVLQLTAYSRATHVQHGDKIYPMPTVDRFVILHVTAAGVREVEVPVGMAEIQGWMGCLDLYYWSETMKGRRL